MGNLAELLQVQGRFEEAAPLHRQTLKCHRAKLGEKHPSTLTCMNNLPALLQTQGRYEEAEPLSRQVLEGCRAQLGDEHPYTLASMKGLISCTAVGSGELRAGRGVLQTGTGP